MRESDLMRAIQVAGTTATDRLFRNQVGTGYTHDGRFITFGLAKHSPDLIGWRSVTITPDMVGQRVAIFTGLEVKTDSGRVDPGQQRFIDLINSVGGIGKIVRSVAEIV